MRFFARMNFSPLPKTGSGPAQHWSEPLLIEIRVARPTKSRWPLPSLRPKRFAYGSAGLRFRSGQRDSSRALITQPSAGNQLENLFHLTYR